MILPISALANPIFMHQKPAFSPMFNEGNMAKMNPLWLTNTKSPHCRGPYTVESVDFLVKGPVKLAYIDSIRDKEFKHPYDSHKRQLKFETNSQDLSFSDMYYIDRSRYISSMIRTYLKINNIKKYSELKHEEKQIIINVLKDIYEARTQNDASFEDLLSFSAIALHNFDFSKAKSKHSRNNKNKSLNYCPRGLMQWNSEKYYKLLTEISRSRIDYIKQPYQIDWLSKESINDEFKAFLKAFVYKSSEEKLGVQIKSKNSFCKIVELMASDEGKVLREEKGKFIKILKNVEISEDLKKKLVRRANIYNMLRNDFLFCISSINLGRKPIKVKRISFDDEPEIYIFGK